MSETSESEFHDLGSMELYFGFDFLPKTSDGFDSLRSKFSNSDGFNLTIRDKERFKCCVYTSISAFFFILVLVPLLHFGSHEKGKNIGASQNNLTLALNRALLFFDAQKCLDAADLVGGFYGSGNNFSTAQTVTLLSWTVIEYRQKYADIGELDHIKDIIAYGSDCLLKLFTTPVSIRAVTDADIAGEIVAGLSAASLVFSVDQVYSRKLVHAAEKLFGLVSWEDPTHKSGTYTKSDAFGDQKEFFYNSSAGYVDELVWAGTWLFFATGNTTYLKYATDSFVAAEEEDMLSGKEILNWNNRLTASAILLTRIRYFIDLGYPYEDALSTNRSDLLMCAYLSSDYRMLSVANGATASFLSKLYSDYLRLLGRTVGACSTGAFSVEVLQDFAMSQLKNVLEDDPIETSYLVVAYGDHHPNHVHRILDDRNNHPWLTAPSISRNAGLVAALVALHGRPVDRSRHGGNSGIDKMGMFRNVHLI